MHKAITAAMATLVLLGAAASTASALPHISTQGIGAAHWGMTPQQVSQALGHRLDCSQGMVGSPARCFCPTVVGLGVRVMFSGERADRLVAVQSLRRRISTTRRVHPGSSMAFAARRYPQGRVVSAGLNGGLQTFRQVDGPGRTMLAIVVDYENNRQVGSLMALADRAAKATEFCG